jgi:hypothetical protein
MTMTMRAIGLLMIVATPAVAHIVPIDPSTCALDIALALPDAGLVASVDPAAPDDLLRASYIPDTSPTLSRVLVCPADPAAPSARCRTATPPRGFVLGGTAGTITLPGGFDLRLLSSGDLDATNVPIMIAAGGPPVAVPFTLTTGFVVAGGVPVLGAPIDAGGVVHIVGTGSSAALPAPLGGAAIRLELGCTLAPPPDLDQFAVAPRLTKVRGTITADKVKLTILLESELAMAADPGGVPTVLRVGPEGAALIQEVMTLQPGPRGRFVSGGGELTLMPLRRRRVRAQKIVLRSPLGQSVPLASGETVLAVETGGLMARRAVTLAKRGARLKVKER